jgi:hypothetical protein
MTQVRFEARELNTYAEPVTPDGLKEGEVYFSIQFADDEMLIPIMETWVFVGRNLDPEIPGEHLYFQDVESYREGVRYSSATEDTAQFQVPDPGNIKHFFDFEHALEGLIKCSLRRSKALS